MRIDYGRFVRVTSRCGEVAAAQGASSIVAIVYKEKAEGPITAFLNAHKAVEDAESAYTKEHREGREALVQLDQPYRLARSTVAALFPDIVLPETLKSLSTDTDKMLAVERLLDIVDDHVGTPWADLLLAGPFGQLAPKVVKELSESIAADSALYQAIVARAAAYGPAYEAYLPFKRVVRDALGPGSREYRRINLRASPSASKEDEEDGAAPAVGEG